MSSIDIGYLELSISLLFVLFSGLSSLLLGLDLHKSILLGAIRTIIQLSMMGYVLKYIFRLNSVWIVLAMFLAMMGFAVRIIWRRVKNRNVGYAIPTLVSMFITQMTVTFVITALIIKVKPWYNPVYFIPLGGMVVGNTMNAIAISLDRLFDELKKQRQVIEMYLSLGANYQEASAEIARIAIGAGMIPSINSMMGVGIVSLPGMMTGQIITGADPLVAIKYQIMIMLMLVGATALGSILATLMVRRKCFSGDHRLLI